MYNKVNLKELFHKYNKQILIGGIVLVFVVTSIIALVLVSRNNNSDESASLETEIETQSKTNEHIEVIAAEVGEIDDENDPLKESTENGAVVTTAQLEGANSLYSNGIDVSKWQGKIDWNAVKNTGIDFAMIRVGYRTEQNGTICEDPYAAYNLQKAQEAGIKIGVYFFSTAISVKEALEEAAWTSDYIQAYPITYPVVYNCEGFRSSDSRMYNVSNDERTSYAMAFLNYISNAGYNAMLYAAKSELEGSKYWNTNEISSKYSIWVAHYAQTTYPSVEKPDYTGNPSMWQYTNKGVVDGIEGYTDLNVAYFSYDTVAEPKNPDAVKVNADSPELGINFTSVSESVTAKDITNLRTLPSTKGDIVYTLPNGEVITRTGLGDNGWSRVEYNGQTLYAVTSYLTTDLTPTSQNGNQNSENTDNSDNNSSNNGVEAGITFESVNETVTAKEETNLRNAPTSSSQVVVTIKNGTTATRTGLGDNGWSRVEYNGQILYAVTSLLTTDLSSNTEDNQADNTVNQMTFSDVNDRVTAKAETNLRTLPTTDSQSTVVVTIKNGEYVTRTGTSTNGWSRVEYNGQVLYAVTSYLTN